jgi:Sec-independent protein secretion pathway component TatC
MVHLVLMMLGSELLDVFVLLPTSLNFFLARNTKSGIDESFEIDSYVDDIFWIRPIPFPRHLLLLSHGI